MPATEVDCSVSDSNLTQILDQAVYAVVQIDEKNRVSYMNAAAEELWQVSRRDVMGKNVKMLVPQHMQSEHDGWVNKNRRTGRDKIVGSSRDISMERSDGTTRLVNLSLSKTEDSNGKISYTAFLLDVTEDRQAQESIGQTLEQALDAVVSIDADNQVTFFNAAAEELWGYDRDEVIGQNVKMLVPREMQPRHDGFVNANRNTGIDKIVGTSREVPVHRKDGDVRWGNLSLSRVQLASGDKIYTAFVRDVTEEVARRRQIEVLSMVANETAAAVMVTNGRGEVIFANHGFTDQSGFSARDVEGTFLGATLTGADTDARELAKMRDAIENHRPFEGELLLYKQDGTPYWVSMAINPVKGDDGGIENYVALLINIDQVKSTAVEADVTLTALAETNGVADWSADGKLGSVNSFLKSRSATNNGNVERGAYALSNLLEGSELQTLKSDHRLTKLLAWPGAEEGEAVFLDATFNAVLDSHNEIRKIIMCGADATARKTALSEVERAVDKLRDSGEKIGDFGTQINAIALQTDMLSVNASIEAAHAGRRGKGFGVVANSVKSLAERSLDSAEKIGDIVEANRKTITDVTDTLRRLNG